MGGGKGGGGFGGGAGGSPESKPLFSSRLDSIQEKLPGKYKLPTVRKQGGAIDQLVHKLDQEKNAQQKQREKAEATQLKASQQNSNEPQFKQLTTPEWNLFKRLRTAQSQKQIQDHFTIQMPIDGTRLLIDFAFPKVGLAIEIDSEFHGLESQIGYDAKKDKILTQHGWTILRFSTRQVEESMEDLVIPTILKSLDLRKQKQIKNGLFFMDEMKYSKSFKPVKLSSLIINNAENDNNSESENNTIVVKS